MHNIAIPFITILIAVAGRSLTTNGLIWYKTIKKPSWTPSGMIIGLVWTTIFTLAAISALIVWNLHSEDADISISMLYLANGGLNLLWSYIFFTRHRLGLAIIEATALNITTIILMILIWPFSIVASLLLLPYVLWVSFATYLAAVIWKLNR